MTTPKVSGLTGADMLPHGFSLWRALTKHFCILTHKAQAGETSQTQVTHKWMWRTRSDLTISLAWLVFVSARWPQRWSKAERWRPGDGPGCRNDPACGWIHWLYWRLLIIGHPKSSQVLSNSSAWAFLCEVLSLRHGWRPLIAQFVVIESKGQCLEDKESIGDLNPQNISKPLPKVHLLGI